MHSNIKKEGALNYKILLQNIKEQDFYIATKYSQLNNEEKTFHNNKLLSQNVKKYDP